MRKIEATLLFVSISLSIIFMEIALRAFTIFPIHNDLNISPHSSLGHTLNPRLGDVDSDGFRNPDNTRDKVLDIVAIGDSHTQGFNVPYEQSWPAVLAITSNKNVYNYGIGGYGFPHYAYLLEADLTRKADTIIVALYPSNDIRPGVCALVPPSFYKSLIDKQLVTMPCSSQPNPIRNKPSTIVNWLTTSSAIASLRKHITSRYFISKSEYYDISGHLIKKSRVAVRNKITDLSNPEVSHNFESTMRILKRAHQTKKNLGVLLIPSKSRILNSWAIKHKVDIPDSFKTFNEAKLITEFSNSLSFSGIPVIDATPHTLNAFELDVRANKLFYPHNDGHPFGSGYHAYSDAASELLDLINSPN